MEISRRDFTRWATVGGIALSLSRAGQAQGPAFEARETLPGRGTWNPSAAGAGRIDGPAKVSGAKLYASDFRAADLPGWPATTSHALLIRAGEASHIFTGIDLSRLGEAIRPSRVVMAADLEEAGVRTPSFYADALFCSVGKTPLYLGQPLALLIFDRFDAFDQARLALRDPPCASYGTETGPLRRDPYGAYRFVRVAGERPDRPDVYSPLEEGWIVPRRFNKDNTPVWMAAQQQGESGAKATFHAERIRAELAAGSPDLLVLDRTFDTQSVDPMFLEPEAGLGWYDADKKSLELVIGVQSPQEATESVAYCLGEAHGGLRPERIHSHFAYLGGGFGGRDHTPFPLYVALAAMFFPGRPVRLAHSRFEQFQSGIKRHAFRMRTRVGVDRKSGRIQAFAADHLLDGGGSANYSASVATVAATGAIGIYDIPRVDVTTVAVHSRGVPAGSMRGYGTTQTMTALEVLIDEAAQALSIDPIDFRRRNALPTGGRTMVGNRLAGVTRTVEILNRLEAHSIWRERAAEKARARPGFLVGTGVACVTKDYGSGADCTQSAVTVSTEGRIAIRSDAVEMGTAIGTALANRVAAVLGAVSDSVLLAATDGFGPLELVTSGDPYSMGQADQDGAAKDARWVPAISAPSSASIGAHISTHGANEAARVVFRFGLWPAALDLWKVAPTDPLVRDWESARWRDGNLIVAGRPPLTLRALSERAHTMGAVTGAMVHGFNRWEWSRATFSLAGEPWSSDIDALAVRMGSQDGFRRIERLSVRFPPAANERIGTAYSSVCGTLARIEIERATGQVRVAKAYSAVECGPCLVPEVVRGQAQGGFAMGLGQALLEFLPLYEDGPGNGGWNLGRYVVARASDLPLRALEIEVLPPMSPADPPKGMAEVVMIPIIPAILGAIHDATGHRFRSLPVTSAMLKGVLS